MANATQFLPLSESDFGEAIVISSTTPGSGTLVHQSAADTTTVHNVWIEAYNGHTAAVEIGVEVVNSTNPIKFTVPAKQGLWLICDGIPLKGDTGVQKNISVYAVTTNVISIYGKHFAITP